jgi:hypothetical protein
MDWAALSEELREISEDEGWAFHAPDPAAVDALETKHGITLPEPYRRFVREVASGIATDCMQLVQLGDPGGPESRPAGPFPLDAAFGDAVLAALKGRPFAQVAGDPAFEAGNIEGTPPGCLVVGELDGVYSALVITGPQRGQVWQLGDLAFPETRQRHTGDGDDRRLDFGGWFECWLQENGLKLKTPRVWT